MKEPRELTVMPRKSKSSICEKSPATIKLDKANRSGAGSGKPPICFEEIDVYMTLYRRTIVTNSPCQALGSVLGQV